MSFLQSMANALASAIDRRTDEEEARERALHDPLTGLPNRALFADQLRPRSRARSAAAAGRR